MKLTAIYRESRNGNIKHMTDDYYNTKQHFIQDLKGNGYITIAVLTDKDIEEIKNRTNKEFKEEMKILDKYKTRNYIIIDYVDECFN